MNIKFDKILGILRESDSSLVLTGTELLAGNNIVLTPDSEANTVTISSTGSTGGTSIEHVNTYADLPDATLHTGEYYYVDSRTGFLNPFTETRNAGLYRSTGILWINDISQGIWGSLTGTLSNQSDLQTVLNEKINSTGHILTDNNFTNLLKTSYDLAVTNSHIHENKTLLDGIVSNGDGLKYLSNDGTYKTITSNISYPTLPLIALGTITSSITLTTNSITTANVTNTIAINLPTVLTEGFENIVCFDFTTNSSTQPTISSVGLIKWSDKNGSKPPLKYSTLSGVFNRLVFKTIDGGTNWKAEYTIYGAVEVNFIRPNLTSNGTIGGSSFAVSASSADANSPIYLAFDGSSIASSCWQTVGGVTSATVIIYNPYEIKVSSFDYKNYVTTSSYAPNAGTVYGSNDNVTYTTLQSFTNTNTTAGATWSILINSENRGFYKYYKMVFTGTISGGQVISTEIGINATYFATT